MDINKRLEKARDLLKPIRASEEEAKRWEAAGYGKVTEFTFYHSTKTRHNAILMTLNDGTEVIKTVKEENFLPLSSSFSQAEEIYVWYDGNKIVQQFTLTYHKK